MRPSPETFKPFTKDDVAKWMDKVYHEEIQTLRKAGQAEYAHDDDAPFRNFEADSRDLGMSREMALIIFARKHMNGIVAYIRGHRSQREDVRGRINDVIVYMFILRCMIEEDLFREAHARAFTIPIGVPPVELYGSMPTDSHKMESLGK
jgi:hypothetical protein